MLNNYFFHNIKDFLVKIIKRIRNSFIFTFYSDLDLITKF